MGYTAAQGSSSHPSSPATLAPHEMVLVSAATRRAPLLPATERVCQLDRSSTILGYLSCRMRYIKASAPKEQGREGGGSSG